MYVTEQPTGLIDIAFWIALLAACLALLAFYETKRRYRRERGRRRRYENHVRILHGATAEAREAFVRYTQLHHAKSTPEGDAKAKANGDLADAMSIALQQTGYEEPGPLQQAFINQSRKMERGMSRAMASRRSFGAAAMDDVRG